MQNLQFLIFYTFVHEWIDKTESAQK
jgi:hypothetical protein